MNRSFHGKTIIHLQFKYGKCSKISSIFLFQFTTKLLVFKDGIRKMLVKKSNSEDTDQTASSEAV